MCLYQQTATRNEPKKLKLSLKILHNMRWNNSVFPSLPLHNQENEILTEQEELISLEQVLRRQIATEKEEIERLRAEIADIQR